MERPTRTRAPGANPTPKPAISEATNSSSREIAQINPFQYLAAAKKERAQERGEQRKLNQLKRRHNISLENGTHYTAQRGEVWYVVSPSLQHPGYWYVGKVDLEVSVLWGTKRPFPPSLLPYVFERYRVPWDLRFAETASPLVNLCSFAKGGRYD
jgi:hypothetical protein